MEEQTARPEDLPALELRTLRDLEVSRPDGSDRAPYIESASAVVRRGDFAYVVGDDELDLAVFTISSTEPGELRPALPGELSDDAGERQGEKPDLEALSILPPFEGAPYGAILGLGSGSDADGGRDRGFSARLGADGSLAGDPEVIDLHPLYELLRGEVERLNVEGAAVLGDRFWLFHRGNAGGRNVVAELALDEVMGSLTGDRSLEADELRAVRAYDLGALGGTPLCFSDATPLTDSEIAFTASAEDEDRRHPRLGRGHDRGRRRGAAAADDRRALEGRGRARRDRHRRDRLRLRLRPGLGRRAIAAVERDDAGRRGPRGGLTARFRRPGCAP